LLLRFSFLFIDFFFFFFFFITDNTGKIITYIGHDSQDYITVNGYDAPGSYVRQVQYATMDMWALEDIIERADTCRQYVEYKCNNSRLLAPLSKSEVPSTVLC
jgi:hypothetical protein